MGKGAVDLEPLDPATRATDLRFAIVTVGALFVTHAIAFFLHEYSHAAMAWLLGFKSNPLHLHYGHLDLSNILLQQEIDENVDYKPIFDAGHGYAAAAIALSGAAIGNGVLYVALRLILRRHLSRMRPASALFLFWLALMACANLWSYAPVRTITTHGDMALAAQGLGISAWTLFPFVVLPSVWAAWDFFRRLAPVVLDKVYSDDVLRRQFVMTIACFIFFGFYGGCPAVGGNYGNVAAVFSIISMLVLFPIALMMTLSPLRVGPASVGSMRSGMGSVSAKSSY
ncbi:hypothetical protein ACFQU1_23470 [Chelatococcus sp. GCM10030263]|uniref:hypothetical protein n=1 Tax=Chelatococcus sp. GCM10030263 TaxID=3273387 RepID=UPI003610B29B